MEEVNAELRGWAADGVLVLDSWKLLEDHGKLRGVTSRKIRWRMPEARNTLETLNCLAAKEARAAQGGREQERQLEGGGDGLVPRWKPAGSGDL